MSGLPPLLALRIIIDAILIDTCSGDSQSKELILLSQLSVQEWKLVAS